MFEHSPRKSTRRLSQESDLSRSSVMCVMHQDLQLFQYKIANHQQRIEDHLDFLDFTFFSDEANFHLDSHVRKPNMCFWAQAHEQEHQYRPLSVEKVTVGCALRGNGTILVRGCWWTSGNCEHRAIYSTNEKKIHPGTEAEVRSGHGYCDLSAGWSNTTLLQRFTRIPLPLLSWRYAHLPSNGLSLA